MQFNKKFLGGLATVVALSVVVTSFQNCAQSSTSSDNASTGGGVTALAYPSTSYNNLVAGQSITLKITKPSTMGDAANYMWYTPYSGSALITKMGLPVESNGYLYVSLTVRSDLASTVNFRLYFLTISGYSYLDGNGILISANPLGTVTPYTSDSSGEMCALRSSYVPSLSLNRSTTADAALSIFDNGAGVTYATCSFGGSTSVDCLTTASWPSGWASQSLTVYTANRCGTTYSQSF